MPESILSPYSLAASEIAMRQRRFAALMAQAADIQKELGDLQRWFDAVKIIFPTVDVPTSSSSTIAPETGLLRHRDWREIVRPYVHAAQNGISPKELIDAIENSDDEEAKERIFQNPNGHHSGLERLLVHKEAVRHNSRYYEPAIYQNLLASGELQILGKSTKQEGILRYTYDIVKEGGPSLPNEVIGKLRQHDEYSRMLTRNPQYGYTILSRLVKRGYLLRDGAHYVAALQTNEPSDDEASDGSDAGSEEGLFS